MDKKVILVVSFGTSYYENGITAIGAVEQEIQQAFPDWEVRRAFTSGMIRRKLQERDGIAIDSVEEAMDRLVREGVPKLVVQPTHVMHGQEYDGMMEAIRPYAGRFQTLGIGRPLLSSTQDYLDLSDAFQQEFLIPEDTLLVLMGHGTEHFANASYAALSYHFQQSGADQVLIGTVEGYPGLDETIKWAKEKQAQGFSKVILTPLMLVAGDHAKNDMAGEEDSWKSAFAKEGFQTQCVLKGMGEYERIRRIYVEHVRQAAEEKGLAETR